MSISAYRIIVIITAVIMLVGLVASTVIGGCDTLIPCESGAFPMKCHWTFIATTAVFAAGTLAALTQLLLVFAESKAARRFAALATALFALIAAFLPTPLGIGICAASGMAVPLCADGSMDCHLSAPIVWVCAALLVIIAVVQALKADPHAAQLPRIDDDRIDG